MTTLLETLVLRIFAVIQLEISDTQLMEFVNCTRLKDGQQAMYLGPVMNHWVPVNIVGIFLYSSERVNEVVLTVNRT